MLSAKIFQTDGVIKSFKSDFPINSIAHVRVLTSNDNITYTDIDMSLVYVQADEVTFYGVAPTAHYLKIIVATNPDELYLTEIDDVLSEIEDLVNKSDTINNNNNLNINTLNAIKTDITNKYNSVVSINANVSNILEDVLDNLTLSNQLVTTSNQNKLDIDDKISEIETLKTDADLLVSNYQTIIGGYNQYIIDINAKNNELNGYKQAIIENSNLTTQAAQDAEEFKNLALQYKNEAIQTIKNANLNIGSITKAVQNAQQLEGTAATHATTAQGYATTCQEVESTVNGLVTSIQTYATQASQSASEAESAVNQALQALEDATDIASGNLINDDTPSINMVYSSSKIESFRKDIIGNLIRDNEISLSKTYSSQKIENEFVNLKFEKLPSYSFINTTDYLHIYNGTEYGKISVNNFATFFYNYNYTFNTLQEATNIYANDYLHIYDSANKLYKKTKVSNVINFTNSSILYNISSETFLGKDNNGIDIKRKVFIKSEATPLSNSFSFQEVLNGIIINLDCILSNETTSEKINITATKNGSSYIFSLNGFDNTVKQYKTMTVYVDYK